VLSSGKFNGIIPEPLAVRPFTRTVILFSLNVAISQKVVTSRKVVNISRRAAENNASPGRGKLITIRSLLIKTAVARGTDALCEHTELKFRYTCKHFS